MVENFNSAEARAFLATIPFSRHRRVWIVTAALSTVELKINYQALKRILRERGIFGVLMLNSRLTLINEESMHWSPWAERLYWHYFVSNKVKARCDALLNNGVKRC